jgi:hypothetical protein
LDSFAPPQSNRQSVTNSGEYVGEYTKWLEAKKSALTKKMIELGLPTTSPYLQSLSLY